MNSPIKVLYIEDDPKELRRIKMLLETSGALSITGVTPNKNINEAFDITNLPDLFLIDYELSKPQNDNPPALYSGTTLTAAIRDRANNYPVVLLTKRSILNPVKEQEHMRELQLIDQLLFKDALNGQVSLNQTVAMLVELAKGYMRLREMAQSEPIWASLQTILEASPERFRVAKIC